ncbi:unnamed protein product [Urochloa decumbens]|uniref:KIB1-4 beta-propeller domain-containing protein n=1 Tax=Urochloa decumbens TaxID=240449 RepID=A0ABC8ZMF2_9POAL
MTLKVVLHILHSIRSIYILTNLSDVWFFILKTCQSISSIFCFTSTNAGTLMMITSRAAQDGSRVEQGLDDGAFGMHTIAEGRSFDCNHKLLVKRSWIGGKDDWLVTTDGSYDMQLINPITGDVVPLPSFTTVQELHIDTYQDDLHVIYEHRHIFRRVVLCQTPSSPNGHFAIALFDDGLMACTARGQPDWKLFTHPTQLFSGCYTDYPEVFLDAVVHQGHVIAVNEGGYMYSWSMDDPEAYPSKVTPPEFSEEHDTRVCYLATSPNNQLLLVCMHGEGKSYYEPSLRMVESEHDRIEKPAAISIHVYDDTEHVWRRTQTIAPGVSLFLGMNYPLYGRWSNVKSDRVYIANMAGNDSIIFSLNNEADSSIEVQDYPIEEQYHLLDGHSIRTPMWFRPTTPSLTARGA